MILLALSGLLIGAVTGTRLKIQVLVPVGAVGLAAVAATTVLAGWTLTSAILAAGGYLVAMQVGFLVGLLVRICMAALGFAPRVVRLPPRRVPAPADSRRQNHAVSARAS